MNTSRPRHRRSPARSWGLPGAAAAIVLFGAVVRGEDDRAVDDLPPAILRLREQRQANRIDLGANFDNEVFRKHGGGSNVRSGRVRPLPTGADADQVPESSSLMVARKLADARLGQIDSVCDLTAAQRRKLRLAMESDIHRVAEDIEVGRRKYQGLEVHLNDQEGRRKWQQFREDVQHYRRQLQSLFDAESLVTKVLPTTLDSEQYARLTADIAARRSCHWRGLVAAAMLKFDDALGLDQRQYDEIEKLLLEREPPLRVYWPATRPDRTAQQRLVWLVLSEIDARRLQGIVSGRQWQALVQIANQGKAMRSFIEAQGLLEQVHQ